MKPLKAVPARCLEKKLPGFEVSWRTEPLYYECELPAGHTGKHAIFLDDPEYPKEEW